MNKRAFSYLQEMGITAWRRRQVGADTHPARTHQTLRAVAYCPQALSAEDASLFTAMMHAVNVTEEQYQIGMDEQAFMAAVTAYPNALHLVFGDASKAILTASEHIISAPMLTVLAQDKAAKRQLWQQLKSWCNHDAT